MHESSFGRLLSVLIAPGKTFRSIAERPTWLVPMVVAALLIGAITTLVMQKADMEEMIRTKIEESGREVPPEVIEQQVEFMEKFGWVFAVVPVIFAPLVYVICAALFLGIFRLLGSDVGFKHSLSTFLYGMAPGLWGSLVAIPIVWSRQSLTIEEIERGGALTSNLSFLAPEEAGPALKTALASLDLFSIWAIILLSIGYRIVARVSAGAAAGTVVGLWLVWVLGKIGWAAIFG